MKSYKIITVHGVKTVQGEPVDMAAVELSSYSEFELFAHKPYESNPCACCDSGWNVSEKISGRSLGCGVTIKEATVDAVERIKECSVERFRELIEAQSMKGVLHLEEVKP